MFVLRRLRAGHGVRFARTFSSDPHAPLNEADVTSKAMRKKLRTQQAPPLALARPPPAPIPEQQQQAELQQQQSTSQARQVEARLRRVVGDGLPGTEGMAALLLAVPDLPELLSAAERAADIAQLDANAAALGAMARAVEAGNRPQLSWTVGANSLLAAGGASPRSAGLSAGVTISVPLLNPAIQHSTQAARQRAEAATLQRADQLELRRQRIVESHEQAGAAFDRLRRVSLVLRDSDRLRNFTLQQWQQLGRRSLFDVIAAESEHYTLRVQYVNALHDGQQMNATLTSLGQGLTAWLQ